MYGECSWSGSPWLDISLGGSGNVEPVAVGTWKVIISYVSYTPAIVNQIYFYGTDTKQWALLFLEIASQLVLHKIDTK